MIKTLSVNVGTTPTLVSSATDRDMQAGQTVSVSIIGAGTVYFGGQDVTPANGFPLVTGQYAEQDLPYGSALWAVVASGTCEVRVKQVGV